MTAFEKFDRSRIHQKPLKERKNKVNISEIYIKTTDPRPTLPPGACEQIRRTAENILEARAAGRSVMLAFGAHSIKNGLGPLMVEFLRRGWITHLATNGAGIIHDWEFAYQGRSSEAVYENLPKGQFGTWEETGFSLNLAIIAGVWQGFGYGASVGRAIAEQGVNIPSEQELTDAMKDGRSPAHAAASADLLTAVRKARLEPGWHAIPAPYGKYSLQAGAYRLGVASTAHPMFGHDIIYTHHLSSGAAIGRAAELDFLSYVDSVSRLNGGVYLSVGTAVMSPMVFEKAYSMVQNAALQGSERLDKHRILVVDLAEPKWDWFTQGEPPRSNPEYHTPYMKSFLRTKPLGMNFLTADNRAFLLDLYYELSNMQPYGK